MTPSEIGERTEAAVLAALTCAGKEVLVPFSGDRRYDLAYAEKGRLIRVQCKSGNERDGKVHFATHSTGNGYRRRLLTYPAPRLYSGQLSFALPC